MNFKKSHLTPQKRVQFIGVVVNLGSRQGLSTPLDRSIMIMLMVSNMQSSGQPSVHYTKAVGNDGSNHTVVIVFDKLHMCLLQL